jgi:hypothetical protein
VSDWDPELVRVLLGSVVQYREGLAGLSERARVTLEALEAARAQVAPHAVAVTDVRAHLPCQGRGCAACRSTGVAAANGRPFAPSAPVPAKAAHVVSVQAAIAAQRKAELQFRQLGELFDRVAGELGRAREHALSLGRFFRQLGG